MDPQELEMISRLRSGEKKAFEELFFDFYPKLTVFAKKYVKDIDTSREIVQDFFVRLYETSSTLNIQTSTSNYLYSSIRNRCLNHLNQNKLHAKHAEHIQQMDHSSHIDFSDKMEQTELEYKIWQVASQLPEQNKRIFYLSRKEGKKNSEIATQLGISVRTVETQISKALKVMRKSLREYLPILFL